MKIDGLKKLGSGSASDVFLIDENTVIVVGKREDCFANYQSLFEKSKQIEGKITTIKYPKIHEVIASCENFPFGAMIEEYVSGVELREFDKFLSLAQKQELGKNLALFLNQLHSIKAVGDKEQEIKINLQKFDKSKNLLAEYLPQEYIDRMEKIRVDYQNFMHAKNFCLTHGDLNAGNILMLQNGELSGIIDFGNMEFYVPQVEFAHMYFFDKAIYDAMVKNYVGQIKDADVILVELVMRIRHFKNIVDFEEKRKNCIENIKNLLNSYKK